MIRWEKLTVWQDNTGWELSRAMTRADTFESGNKLFIADGVTASQIKTMETAGLRNAHCMEDFAEGGAFFIEGATAYILRKDLEGILNAQAPASQLAMGDGGEPPRTYVSDM